MSKMKLNNNDITVVPRFIDESMMPTLESLKKEESLEDNTEQVSLEENKPKCKKEKWYVKYKWYIAGVVIVLILSLLIYVFVIKSSPSYDSDENKIDLEEVKKIKSNIILDNESISSDLFYNKKLTPILEEDENIEDEIKNEDELNKKSSVEKWIDDTREELINKSNETNSVKSNDTSDSKLQKTFIEDLNSVESIDTKKNDLAIDSDDE